MARTVKLEVITPSKMFYKGEVELVVVTTPAGEEGFMANHSWTVKLVDIGSIKIREPGSKEMKEAFVSGGYIDVKENILIYVDAAEWVWDIDYEKAVKQKGESEQFLANFKISPAESENGDSFEKSASESISELAGDALPPQLVLEVNRMERKLRRANTRIRLVKKHERMRNGK